MGNEILVKYQNVEIKQLDNIVLKSVNLEIGSGEFIYLVGKVGSGKSTLIKSIYSEIPISRGEASILGHNLNQIKRKEISAIRRKMGIIFQDFQLLIDRTINDNLLFVLKSTGWNDKIAISKQINKVLEQVGMQNKGYKMPHQLSGGEQQRIVIARSLLNSPEIILADEPTGNLDPKTGTEIMNLLYSIRETGTTVLIATHNLGWIDTHPGRVLECNSGNIVEIKKI